MPLQESGEMYLETIYVLSQKGSNVRSIDICEHLGYSKPSVSRAVGLLKNGGYIAVSPEGYITLTEVGTEVSQKLFERHTVLSSLLIKLGVDESTATKDACRIEHVISETSFNALKKYIENILEEKSRPKELLDLYWNYKKYVYGCYPSTEIKNELKKVIKNCEENDYEGNSQLMIEVSKRKISNFI